MKNQDDKYIEHRGNAGKVSGELQLEMQLVRNVNKENPAYSFDNTDDTDKKESDFKGLTRLSQQANNKKNL